ncbi:MAG: ABC transporter permease, partial [Chitinivibrionales bacterium]|nr:ABC transporter permease [Chitinivibrionales bacterium]
MKPYWAHLAASMRLLLQYRAAAIAGAGTQAFWGIMRMMIFAAFYAGGAGTAPMSLDEVIAYIWLGQAFLVLTPFTGGDRELTERIRSGMVVFDLLRPVDPYAYWFSRVLAGRLAPALLRALPILVLATLAGWLRWPAPAVCGAWLLSMASALLLSSAMVTAMTLSAFWTLSGQGIIQLMAALSMLLSGLIVPLPLFPAPLQPLLDLLPFRGLVDIPFRVFTGHVPLTALPSLLAHQAGWTLALALIGRLTVTRALRRVVIQGG